MDFDPTAPPPAPPKRYIHIGIGNGTLKPIRVSESIYRLVERIVTQARKKAAEEHETKMKAGNPE